MQPVQYVYLFYIMWFAVIAVNAYIRVTIETYKETIIPIFPFSKPNAEFVINYTRNEVKFVKVVAATAVSKRDLEDAVYKENIKEWTQKNLLTNLSEQVF